VGQTDKYINMVATANLSPKSVKNLSNLDLKESLRTENWQ